VLAPRRVPDEAPGLQHAMAYIQYFRCDIILFRSKLKTGFYYHIVQVTMSYQLNIFFILNDKKFTNHSIHNTHQRKVNKFVQLKLKN